MGNGLTVGGYATRKEINMEAISKELMGMEDSLEKIRMTSNGADLYEVPGVDVNEPEFVKEFTAVILYQRSLNEYFKEKYTGGKNPPDCRSVKI